MSFDKRKVKKLSCHHSLVSYYPLVWIFYSESQNKKLNALNERAL